VTAMADRERPVHAQRSDARPPAVAVGGEKFDRDRALGYQYGLISTGVLRLLALNTGHATTAWRRRRSDPIAPYVLVLLYAQPNPDFHKLSRFASPDDWAGAWHIKATTRIWTAGPETQDLAQMLFHLEQYVIANQDADGWSMREQLMTSIDPGMRADAVWVGLAVSSLDTKTGAFAQVCDTAFGEAQVPGVIRLVINVEPEFPGQDLAWIVGDRRGLNEFGIRTIHSTHRVADIDYHAPFTYGLAAATDLANHDDHGPVLRRMYGLYVALHRAQHFARPPGMPAYGTQWREIHGTGRRS